MGETKEQQDLLFTLSVYEPCTTTLFVSFPMMIFSVVGWLVVSQAVMESK